MRFHYRNPFIAGTVSGTLEFQLGFQGRMFLGNFRKVQFKKKTFLELSTARHFSRTQEPLVRFQQRTFVQTQEIPLEHIFQKMRNIKCISASGTLSGSQECQAHVLSSIGTLLGMLGLSETRGFWPLQKFSHVLKACLTWERYQKCRNLVCFHCRNSFTD